MKGYAREKMREITADRSALRKCRNAVSAGVLSPISSAVGRNGAVGDKESARAGARNYPCAAAADAVRVGVGALVVFGDYQIAPKPPGGRLWLVAADAAGVWGTPPTGGTGSFTPLRGYTSSVTASPCHLPLEGKAFFARGRFFWLCLSLFVCLSLFGSAGQAGEGQE